MKCDNCQVSCGKEVVAYFEYVGPDRLLMSVLYVAACDKYEDAFDNDNWKLISKEEYIIGRILHD